jgi:hypothetical protein
LPDTQSVSQSTSTAMAEGFSTGNDEQGQVRHLVDSLESRASSSLSNDKQSAIRFRGREEPSRPSSRRSMLSLESTTRTRLPWLHGQNSSRLRNASPPVRNIDEVLDSSNSLVALLRSTDASIPTSGLGPGSSTNGGISKDDVSLGESAFGNGFEDIELGNPRYLSSAPCEKELYLPMKPFVNV